MKSIGIWEDFGSMIADTKAHLAERGWKQDVIPQSWTIEARKEHCRQALKDMPGTALILHESKLIAYATEDESKHGSNTCTPSGGDYADVDYPPSMLRGSGRARGGKSSSTIPDDITGILAGAVARQRLRAATSEANIDVVEEPAPKTITVPRIAFEEGMKKLALLQSSTPNTPRSGGEQAGLDLSLSGRIRLTPRGQQLSPRGRVIPTNSSTIHTPPHPSRAGMSQLNTPRPNHSTNNTPRGMATIAPSPYAPAVEVARDMVPRLRVGDGLPKSATARSLTGTQYSGPASRHVVVPRDSGPTTFRKVMSNRGAAPDTSEIRSATQTSLSGSYEEDEGMMDDHTSVIAENQIDPIAQYLEEQLEFIGGSDADIPSNLQQYDSYMGRGNGAVHTSERDYGPTLISRGGKRDGNPKNSAKPGTPTASKAPFRLY